MKLNNLINVIVYDTEIEIEYREENKYVTVYKGRKDIFESTEEFNKYKYNNVRYIGDEIYKKGIYILIEK